MSNNRRKTGKPIPKPGGTKAVKFDGHTYRLPAQEDWPIETLESMLLAEDNPLHMVTVIKSWLGAQYEPFKQRHKTIGKLNEFFEAVRDVMNDETDEEGSAPNS